MTQNTEQKVHARAEQVLRFGHELIALRGSKDCTELSFAERHIQEAEARGAAEQRRKDAEGQEPVAWIFKIRVMGTDAWIEHTSTTKVDPIPGMRRDIRPLFDRPANVAALEARVKELDSQNRDLLRELNTTYLERDRYRNCMSDCVDLLEKTKPGTLVRVWLKDCLETARAALKREGGV